MAERHAQTQVLLPKHRSAFSISSSPSFELLIVIACKLASTIRRAKSLNPCRHSVFVDPESSKATQGRNWMSEAEISKKRMRESLVVRCRCLVLFIKTK